MRLQIKWRKGWAYACGAGPDGRRVRRALGTRDPVRAEEARSALEARLWRLGLYGAEAVLTFAEAALAYAQDGGETRFLVPMTRQLGDLRLPAVTPHAIRAAARAAYPDAAAATLNRQGITPARAVMNYAAAQGWCAPIRVRAFPARSPARRAVDRSYLDALQPHLPARAFALMLFLHQTGRRVGDAVALQPGDIDLRTMTAHIRAPKNGRPVTVHLTAELAATIAQIAPRGGRVFGYASRQSLYGVLRRACDKAGLPYLGTHQPGRHSFATSLSAAGWNPRAIADAGGWQSVRLVSEVYDHPTDAAARAAQHFGTKLAQGPGAGQKKRAGSTRKAKS